jgi:hypothetical protein
MVGTRRLADCCASPLPDSQVPTCPFSTIYNDYEVSHDYETPSLVFVRKYVKYNHPGCPRQQWESEYQSRATSGASQYQLNGYDLANARWDVSSDTILTGTNGPVVRPGTNTIVARASFKYREYTFNRTSRIRTYKEGQDTSELDTYFNAPTCCPAGDSQVDFPIIKSPAQTIDLTPSANDWFKISWVGKSTQRVLGFRLTLRAAGAAVGPWRAVVEGGQLKLTNGSGVTTTYTGLLTAVRTSINGAGFFTAFIPTGSPTPVTTSAEIQDLKPYKSTLLTVTNEQTCMYIVDVGDEIAPGSQIGGVFPPRLSSLNSSVGPTVVVDLRFDAASSGFPNTADGLLQYMQQTWYAKASGGAPPLGLNWVLFPYPLGFPPQASLTPGASVTNYAITYGVKQKDTRDYQVVCAFCNDPGAICDIPGAQFLLSASFPGPEFNCYGFEDCSGSTVSNICGCPPAFQAYGTDTLSIEILPAISFPAVYSVQGTFKIS